MDSLGSLRRYAERSRAPVCASETLSSRWGFRDLLETEAAGIIMLDLSWCGGLSEGRKIAAMAEAWHLPVAPHDCTGPVVLAASTHLALSTLGARQRIPGEKEKMFEGAPNPFPCRVRHHHDPNRGARR